MKSTTPIPTPRWSARPWLYRLGAGSRKRSLFPHGEFGGSFLDYSFVLLAVLLVLLPAALYFGGGLINSFEDSQNKFEAAPNPLPELFAREGGGSDTTSGGEDDPFRPTGPTPTPSGIPLAGEPKSDHPDSLTGG